MRTAGDLAIVCHLETSSPVCNIEVGVLGRVLVCGCVPSSTKFLATPIRSSNMKHTDISGFNHIRHRLLPRWHPRSGGSLFLFIQDIPGSNFGQGTVYPKAYRFILQSHGPMPSNRTTPSSFRQLKYLSRYSAAGHSRNRGSVAGRDKYLCTLSKGSTLSSVTTTSPI
jgi:hypothetical protein